VSNGNLQISRVTRTKSQARAVYDEMSRWYDLLEKGFERKAVEIGLRLLGPQGGEEILELGFGTGNSIIEIARRVGNLGKVYGLDISPGMLRVTQRKLDKQCLSQRVELATGDAACLPYDSEVFDAIFMSFTLELFDTPEIPIVLSECRRVLKKNGRICVVAMSKKTGGAIVSLYEWAHSAFPKYIDCRPIFLTELLRACNFEILHAKTIKMWGFPMEISLARTPVS
jgi:ubiquinone/menaquinone biosynthesis C-methylase UbiE